MLVKTYFIIFLYLCFFRYSGLTGHAAMPATNHPSFLPQGAYELHFGPATRFLATSHSNYESTSHVGSTFFTTIISFFGFLIEDRDCLLISIFHLKSFTIFAYMYLYSIPMFCELYSELIHLRYFTTISIVFDSSGERYRAIKELLQSKTLRATSYILTVKMEGLRIGYDLEVGWSSMCRG